MNIKTDNSKQTNGTTLELLSFMNRWLFWPVFVVVLLEFASLEDRAIVNLLGHTVTQSRYGSLANFVFAAMLMPLLTLAVALFACWKTNQVVSKQHRRNCLRLYRGRRQIPECGNVSR